MGGVEKTFVKIGGRTMLDWVVNRMTHQVDRLAINANGDITRFVSTGLMVIPDLPGEDKTPLSGLHAALQWAKAEDFGWLLTVPSDTPFLPHNIVARLSALKQKAAIAASRGQQHYLTGLWSTSLVPALDDAIGRTPMLRVKDWAKHAGAAQVEWPAAAFDPFFNVNTPQDLAEAQRIAAEFDP
jgi:molybdopterin-guanine dinucleotide biosynthesis protein A